MKEASLFSEHKTQTNINYKSFYKDFFKNTFKKSSIIIPTIILLSIFIIGMVFCHFIDLNKHLQIDMTKAYISPSLEYPFGTNSSGQNQFYIVFIGTYKTLLLAFCATIINIVLGIIFGILWGTSKKFNAFMFIVKNLVDTVPMIFFYVIIVAIIGDGFIPLLLVVILFGWIDFACIIRNTLVIIKSKDYNKVSQLYNVPLHKIALNNYMPSILPILFNNIAVCIPKIIALEILISYFGFSFGSSDPSLGMLFYSSIYSNAYFRESYMFFIPFAFLFTINICTYLVGKTISNNFAKEKF
jgi:oligopeptide transport system permease protein